MKVAFAKPRFDIDRLEFRKYLAEFLGDYLQNQPIR